MEGGVSCFRTQHELARGIRRLYSLLLILTI